jgi:hypothetical protein
MSPLEAANVVLLNAIVGDFAVADYHLFRASLGTVNSAGIQ